MDKSILSLLRVLSRIRGQGALPRARFKADSATRLLFTLLCIVLVSVSGQFAFVAVAAVGVLLRISALRPETILKVGRAALIAAAFTALVLLPAALAGNIYSLQMIPLKVFVSIGLVAVLSHTERWDGVTGALRAFFIPDMMIFVLDITIKYIYLLGELGVYMLYALKLRAVGKNRDKAASLSGVAGTLFMKSREMAADMHAAMQCRGFTGEYKRSGSFKPGAADALYLAAGAALIALFILIGRQ